MDPSLHLSDSNQQWWGPDAGFEDPMNAGASWYPNQVPASEFEPYGIPHEQHGYGHPPPHAEGVQPRPHRSRKRSDQNFDLRDRDYEVNSYRPVFSVPRENVSRTSTDGRYEFAESCHEFMVRPDSGLEGMSQDADGRQGSSRKKSTHRAATHYAQEAEYDDNYAYVAQRPISDFEQGGNQETEPIFYCPQPHCGYASPSKNSLRKHMSIHGAKKFFCENCSADFHAAKDLRRHQETKHTVSNARKNYICKAQNCGRDGRWPFTRKDNARQHVMHVHEISHDRVDEYIEEIAGAAPRNSEQQFRAGHRPTNSSSTDDTIYSNLSYDSNPGYHSHEDLGGEDIIAEFTYLQEYDSDLDLGHPSTQENWQQERFRPSGPEYGKQVKYLNPSSRPQGRRRSRSEVESRSPSNMDPQQASYYQSREHLVRDEDLQQYSTERSYLCSDRSVVLPMQSQVKEESPGPNQRSGRSLNASTATKKPTKHLSNYAGKTYRPETSAAAESLEAAFEKVLTI
ncbi:hypothetical protein TWF718_006593 [Orbilia javanica]|uniref:C2H2-type domain-containing protein n=1 Tax=Orbilia javanica TaxID=47235 RepID=A0AAN8RHI3_9PEZI